MSTVVDNTILEVNRRVAELLEVPYLWQSALGAGFLLWIWNTRRSRIDIPKYGGLFSFSNTLAHIKLALDGLGPFQNAYKNYPMIQIPEFDGWKILVQKQFVDEVLRAPDDVLSFHEATVDMVQMRYTFGAEIEETTYHHSAIRNQLTRSLGVVLPDVHKEIEIALEETVHRNEWTEVTAYTWIQRIVSRASNRIFVGEPLCRDKAWIDLMQGGPEIVLGTSFFINLFPRFLRGIVGNLISPAARRTKKAAEMLRPLYEERLLIEESERPSDMITWLQQVTPEEESSLEFTASRLISVNFAAIHTSGVTLTHAVFWLLAYPEYIQPLREEIEEIIKQHGWSKDSIGKMVKLDSFMKESARISPLGTQVAARKVLKPFTFSNGVTVPVGSTISCPLYALHFDDDIYHDANQFDGFRFLETKEHQEKVEARKTMYTTSKIYMTFGHGRHACPGRFFASLELKAVMASLVLGYDLKWPDDVLKGNSGGRYRAKDLWFAGRPAPNPTAKIQIRKRSVDL
ncbi:putative cycloheximide-inducible protein CIP70 [Serendipita vermifera]|nr:putative cycloheximide-inducible protein CIP70 [Serendipita vermifera]